MTLTKNTGRLVGLLWLLNATAGAFGLLYIRSRILLKDYATGTAAHIMASQSWYRVAIVSIIVAQVLLLFTGLTLFRLFKDSDERLARLVLISAIITVVLAIGNTFNHFGALFILSGDSSLRVFTPEQLNAIAYTLLRIGNGTGQALIEIFWTPYYFSLGLLVVKSRALPKIIGILLMVMGVGFAINILQKFLVPTFYPATFTQLAMFGGALGGLPAMFWFLIKGANVRQNA